MQLYLLQVRFSNGRMRSAAHSSMQLYYYATTAFHTSWATIRHYHHDVVWGCRKTKYNRIFQLEPQPLF